MSVTHNSIIALVMTSALIGGCSTTNPYTQEKQTSKATKGAVAGAAAGILAGMIAGDSADDRRDKALIGAALGGATGGGIGYYMDVQEAKLRQQLQGTGVSVTRYGENIILNMPGNITFDSSRADINAGFYPVLDSVVLVLKEFNKTMINVTGHTDSTGSDQLNQILSEQRASSVAQYLMSRQVSAQRFVIRGASKNQPIADNSTESGRATNRRVEITLVPMPQ
ncbi:MAG: OmpA family protein [Immundisolibacteraceae bacterium]|jgi:outer membrane protein OmpA-like peptidoglycan-associated protein|nr:OmpA family protein [Immundisolibacteraceae bacterium]